MTEKKNYFVYLSFSSEAPTDELISALLQAGNRVFCPKVQGEEMVAVEYAEDCCVSRYGIREPVGQPFTGEIHCAITPLLAVDEQGNRLGYGGGYYDRFFKKHKDCVRVAYCYQAQVIKSVCADERDERVDAIVTEEKIYHLGKDNDR